MQKASILAQKIRLAIVHLQAGVAKIGFFKWVTKVFGA